MTFFEIDQTTPITDEERESADSDQSWLDGVRKMLFGPEQPQTKEPSPITAQELYKIQHRQNPRSVEAIGRRVCKS